MPNFAKHPAEDVLIPIGGHDYRFRLTLGSLRRYASREDVDDANVPAGAEEAAEQVEEARRTGKLDGLVDTLWIARQPYKQPGETKEAMEGAITPEDFGAVLAGYGRLMSRQMDAGALKEKAEELSGEESGGEEGEEGAKKKTASNTSAKSKAS